MKTQVFKNSESTKSSNLMILVSMIIFCEILLFVNGSGESNKSSEELMKLNFVTPIQQISFSKTVTRELEKEKLYLKMRLTEEAVKCENEKIKNPAPEVEFSMEKMNAYLIVDNDPELDADIANSIVFPEVEMVEITSDNKLNNDNFLKDLQIQAFEKTRDAVELYALEKKVKEYLTIENEKPLELEEWMISKKCWCPELRETTAMAEKK